MNAIARLLLRIHPLRPPAIADNLHNPIMPPGEIDLLIRILDSDTPPAWRIETVSAILKAYTDPDPEYFVVEIRP